MNARVGVVLLAAMLSAASAQAETGHYLPNQVGMRETLVPDTGTYMDIRSNSYFTDIFRDDEGEEIDSKLRIRGVSLVVSTYLIPFELADLGLKAGFGAQARFTNGSISLGFFTLDEITEASLTYADARFTPAWIGWSTSHLDLAFSYSFYAPVGEYDPDEDLNAGRGFWTHEAQVTLGIFLDEDRFFGLLLRGTYETHSETEGRDVRQGDNLTLEYGWSQVFFEFYGFTMGGTALGYSHFQLQNNGRSSFDGDVDDDRSRVHGVGGEMWFENESAGLRLVLMGSAEYAAHSSLEGWRIGLNFTFRLPWFTKPPVKE